MNFGDNYIWLILLVCCCGNNLCDILPLLLVLECCQGNNGCGGGKMFNRGCGCGCQ